MLRLLLHHIAVAAVLLSFLRPADASAQVPARSFDDLAERSGGQQTVKLLDSNGVVWSGRVLGYKGDELAFETGKNVRIFKRAEVWEIWSERHNSFWKGFLIGGTVGVSLMVLGYFAEKSDAETKCEEQGICIPADHLTGYDVAAGMGIFGFIGGGIAVFGHHRHMLYLAPAD